ncbi:hypothetical protein SAMN05421839_12134 [Halolactibacillus halophilus]|uniref:Transposase, IS30 family n=1 Tax=Halolactibacillus halophilus TaxID=306540 RepID=A0A1I5QG96_9BACI|nr:hypothetical protein [Halolactibacillus halophilus]SFP45263.1 hypothetical protein SAMN05421839_12134 [Halolactibacillus halophilus]
MTNKQDIVPVTLKSESQNQMLYNHKRKLGRSIKERDPAVLTREAFGHWELDLVIGKKTKGESVILTLLERQTRHYVTKKL